MTRNHYITLPITKEAFVPPNPKELDIAIFKNKKGSVVGPIHTEMGYHVFEIIKKYEKGSKMGLEHVHDKIYQRLLKQNQLVLAADLLDSLKEKSTVFINSNYQ